MERRRNGRREIQGNGRSVIEAANRSLKESEIKKK